MVAIMIQRDMRRMRIFPRFLFHHASAVVVLLQVNAVRRNQHQPQPAPFRNLPREKRETTKFVPVDLSRLHQFRGGWRIPVARS